METRKYRKRLVRNTILVTAGLTFVFILSIRPTMRLRTDYLQAEMLNKGKGNVQLELNLMRQKIDSIDAYFSHSNSSKAQDIEVWSEMVRVADSLSLFVESYPLVHQYTENQYMISTQEICLVGDYHNMVKMIREVEHKPRLFVHSATFHLRVDRKTSEKSLVCKIFFQQINLIE